MSTSTAPMIVVGAGYAGILCANRLARRLRQPVLLVSERDTFLHRVRLHETAARGQSSTQPLRRLLHPRVELVLASAVGLDPHARQLELRDATGQRSLRYSKLVLALGSKVVAPFATEAPHALALASHERALAFSRALKAAPNGAWINVIGGGLTAVELASEIAEAHPRLRVRMLCDRLAAHLPTAPRAALESALQRLHVEVIEGASIREIQDGAARDEAGSYPALHSVLATGFRPSMHAWLEALPTSADGRIAVDHALRVVGFTDLFAVGDIASPPASCIGNGLRTTRMGCVNAMPLAAHAADVIARDHADAFHFNYPGQNVSIGRRNAIVLFTDADDQPTGRYLDGRTAALIKELVCRFVVTALRLEARGWLGYAWLGMHSRTPATALPLSS